MLASGARAADPLASNAQSAVPADLNDQGTFEIFVAGKRVGTENFEIRTGPKQIEGQAEVYLRMEEDGKTIEVRTLSNLILDPQLRPLSYSWSQKGAQSSQLTIDFRSSPARTRYKTVNGQPDQRDFKLAKDVVVLDDNLVHHYQLVVDRYDRTKKGKQTFPAFIPQEALPGEITMEDMGPEPVSVEGSTLDLRHLVLTTELARIDLWVDNQDRLQVVSVPVAQFQAVRKK
jgi:hypothetical protein